MMASQELLGTAKRVALLEASIEKLQAEIKILSTNGEDTSANDLTAAIAKHEEKLLNAHFEYQETLQRLSKVAQNCMINDVSPLLESCLILQERYFEIVNWLCKQQITDADGEQKTYWEQFQHDNPYRTIWNCYD